MFAKVKSSFRDVILWTTLICVFCLGYLQTTESLFAGFVVQELSAFEHGAFDGAEPYCSTGQCAGGSISCSSNCDFLIHSTNSPLARNHRFENWPVIMLVLIGRSVGFDPRPPK